MQIREIANGFAVTGQISVDDVAQIAGLGFKTLISNRPDNEMGAIPHDSIRAAAEAAGLAFHYLPVVSGQITRDNVTDMAALLKGAKQPVLAYCRSGGRCTNLYGLVQSMG
jgi:uncharacterized protein (TIGR01244 family)